MSFSLRLAVSIAVLVGCTAVMGIAALLAMNNLHARLQATDALYAQVRGLYEVGHRASAARLLVNATGAGTVEAAGDDPEIRRQLIAALQAADRLLVLADDAAMEDRSQLRATLENIRAGLESSLVADRQQMSRTQQSQALNACLSQVASLAADANAQIAANRQLAMRRVSTAQWTLALLLGLALVLALALGATLYRAIARPLRALRRGVEHVATRRNDEPLAETGPRELRDLIRQFNLMRETVGQLEDSLTQQVESKSRQLIRCERLAGLGYLAAGLAHEINTPLGVISGYAETMLRRLEATRDAADDPAAREELAEALRVISEEVFRCQDITAGLLQMTRHGEERAEAIDLAALVERVTLMLRRLPLCGDRQLLIEQTCTGPLLTRGVRSQLAQVFLNLITNALEAVESGRGIVTVGITAQAGSALIRIGDNGCGMSDETIARVFDPLFTDKPRRGLTGFGLGLSVSHAIVERHGGRIDVTSGGPGCGSTFTVELPALSATSAMQASNATP